MAYHKIKGFLEKLENQNSELEAQKAELREQNAEQEMQKKQLHEASRLKTVFLSNMSHELRTPLNSVIALSGVLSRRLAKLIPEEECSYLEVIERNGRHLLSLINDILDLSRIESGHEEIEISRFNANNLIGEVVLLITPQANEKNIELNYKKETDLIVFSDSDKCRHILQNLIGNAVKFTEKGSVEVICRQNGENIEVAVADTGVGIPKEHLVHIFEEFRQADSSTSRKFGGTGLGLSIAKKYADMLGGSISVQSIAGKGSEFILSLPLNYNNDDLIKNELSACPVKKMSEQQVGDFSAKTILLVEDSEPAIIQIKDILEEAGYQILTARNGEEALRIIDKTIPDAMILDLMMPGIDGFEVLQILREAEPTAHIPVLILTAKHITKEELKFLRRNNVHQLIQKGDVSRVELLDITNKMMPPQIEKKTKPDSGVQIILGNPLVLVVEDNPDNMLTAKALLSDNFRVIEAVNGLECLEMAKKHLPNLILMDIQLPKMDGIEAFKTIRKTPELKHIPVVALTASAMSQDQEIILAHGFDGYIIKPIDEKIFYKIIKDILYG